jgi:hypothetical protein
MPVTGAQKQISQAVLSWPGTSVHPHRFGGVEYRLGKRELGHIHGDHLVDIPFPTRVRDEIVDAGQARPHHIQPDSGWVSFYLRAEGDPEKAIELLRRSFEIARSPLEQRQNRDTGDPAARSEASP